MECLISVITESGGAKVLVADNPISSSPTPISREAPDVVANADGSFEFTLHVANTFPRQEKRVTIPDFDGAWICSGDLIEIGFDGDAVTIRGNY